MTQGPYYKLQIDTAVQYKWLLHIPYSQSDNIPSVAIGNPEKHMRKASHCGSKQQ